MIFKTVECKLVELLEDEWTTACVQVLGHYSYVEKSKSPPAKGRLIYLFKSLSLSRSPSSIRKAFATLMC